MKIKKPRLRTWVSFVSLGLFFMAFAFVWDSITRTPDDAEDISRGLRTGLEMNGRLWKELYSPRRTSYATPPPSGKKPRVNGEIGLESPLDLSSWKLDLPNGKKLTMADLKKMPRTESSTEFRCIEGWSEDISYAGVKFSDFLQFTGLGNHSGKTLDLDHLDADLFPFVGLETPDGEYYVSLDMESMLHPQTILAYEMNGKPLGDKNGAPLRLIVPVKYGIKSLKRIGKIFFSDTRPKDYWAEQGYDWFSGL
ncbi:MAG TPA: molybdopterin-dependent oxidoreductase [Bdellovibrionota bacterium]|jgi:DMSO/TMAO reductase YedYZ molybdopterin-dependent catalytic subunit